MAGSKRQQMNTEPITDWRKPTPLVLFNRERLSFVLRGISNGNTHYLEVCTEEEILYADEIAGRIGTLFADRWVDTQMTADVKSFPSFSPGLKGNLATLLADIVVGCCARETVGVSNANLERRGTIERRFNQ
jgi:hypothetical protein